jgi:hypothetical protein
MRPIAVTILVMVALFGLMRERGHVAAKEPAFRTAPIEATSERRSFHTPAALGVIHWPARLL